MPEISPFALCHIRAEHSIKLARPPRGRRVYSQTPHAELFVLCGAAPLWWFYSKGGICAIHHVARTQSHIRTFSNSHPRRIRTLRPPRMRYCALSHVQGPCARMALLIRARNVTTQRGTCQSFDDVPRTRRDITDVVASCFLTTRYTASFPLTGHTPSLSHFASHRAAPT